MDHSTSADKTRGTCNAKCETHSEATTADTIETEDVKTTQNYHLLAVNHRKASFQKELTRFQLSLVIVGPLSLITIFIQC